MSTYFSVKFLCLFVPAIVAGYSLAPKKARWVVLLLASYACFFLISGKLLVFVMLSTLSVYAAARRMGTLIEQRKKAVKADKERKREIKKAYNKRLLRICVVGALFNLGLLVALKYLVFFGSIVQDIANLFVPGLSIEVPVWGLPIGISFYTLMAVSYLVDVYHGVTEADRHLGRVALFLCFFPTLMEGPICRYAQVAPQLYAGEPVHRENLYNGVVRIMWGVAKKVIVADRLNSLVKPVFADYASFDGGVVAFAAVCYTIQLYCEFSGTMDVVIGVANIFNVKLPENFKQPFFSRTASEFWQRWHITLGAFLRDYVFYPVSLSGPVKKFTTFARKHWGNRYGPILASTLALLCVWLGNGFWHGAGWQYILFGMYYFVLIMLGGLIAPTVEKLAERLNINRESLGYRIFQILRTWVVIFVGELIFRGEGLDAIITMLGSLFGNFTLASFTDGTVAGFGLVGADYLAVAVFIVVLFLVGLARERGVVISERAASKLPLRWGLILVLAFAIIIFGAYGGQYSPVDPIYAAF